MPKVPAPIIIPRSPFAQMPPEGLARRVPLCLLRQRGRSQQLAERHYWPTCHMFRGKRWSLDGRWRKSKVPNIFVADGIFRTIHRGWTYDSLYTTEQMNLDVRTRSQSTVTAIIWPDVRRWDDNTEEGIILQTPFTEEERNIEPKLHLTLFCKITIYKPGPQIGYHKSEDNDLRTGFVQKGFTSQCFNSWYLGIFALSCDISLACP